LSKYRKREPITIIDISGISGTNFSIRVKMRARKTRRKNVKIKILPPHEKEGKRERIADGKSWP
jgi:hypothetical protein